MSEFFIERPIFAWVVAILIMLAGVAAILRLPVTQYPEVAPPTIAVRGTNPGASAQTVQDSVVQIVEQQMNGLDGFRYMTSSGTADGGFEITVVFEQGTNADTAQVQVQNKLQLATPMLPPEVQSQGLEVSKSQASSFVIIVFYCDDGTLAEADLADYMASNLKDTLARVEGVGMVEVWAFPYGMRIWLDPEKLYSFNLIPQDVIAAIQAQNVQVSSGKLAGLPSKEKVQISATVIAKSRLTTAEQFREILVKVDTDGSQVRLKDLGDVELGSERYDFVSRYNGHPAAAMGLRLASGANVLDVSRAVDETLDELKPHLPMGAKIARVSEMAPIVRASIRSVIETLVEAIFLVFLVMWIFLQRFRITLIPTLAVPVVLLGTFAVLFAFGFTVNVITMFAMVLAIGLLVDDAIVVVENVERLMEEEGLSPKEATKKSMKQIQGALVGIGLVLSAVFFPMAFFGGSTGVIYRQFSVTIIAAMTLSVIVALVFTPPLCATILTPAKEHRKAFFLFRWFNAAFSFTVNAYTGSVAYILRRSFRFLVLFAGFVALIVYLYPKLPTGFIPFEDQGMMFVSVEMPQNASMERTNKIIAQVSDHLLKTEGDAIEGVMGIGGFSFAGASQNAGILFIAFKPFEQRTKPGTDLDSVFERTKEFVATIKEARVTADVPPSISELGLSSGVDFYLLDRANLGHQKLVDAQNQLIGLAMESGKFAFAMPFSLPDEPQYRITFDEEKARMLAADLSDVNGTMSIAWGSAYVNDFIDRGRVKRVFVQGTAGSRLSPEDLDKWYVRNTRGNMVPFSSFTSGEWISGPPKLSRFNGFNGLEVIGFPAPGVSSGEGMNALSEFVQKLPQGLGLTFAGLSFEERRAGNQAMYLYGISLLIVFLCLAALYESWSVPAAVMLVVPFGVFGAIGATMLLGLENNVYFQVGMLTVMGLSSKNAILIVEFAKSLYEKENKPLLEAATTAARMRLRPIIMTSMAFVLGVLPMMFAHGASQMSQLSLGTSVVGGTLAATLLAVFFVPLFYVLVAGLFRRRSV